MWGILLLNNEGALPVCLQLKDQTTSEEMQTSQPSEVWMEKTQAMKNGIKELKMWVCKTEIWENIKVKTKAKEMKAL